MEGIERDMVQVFAWFEWKLPMYWNTITKHLLWEILKQMFKWGPMWVMGILSIEQLHCVVKRLGRSRKNMMVSFLRNYELFDNAQSTWNSLGNLINQMLPSDIANRRPLSDSEGVVVVKGTRCLHCFSFP